MTAPAPRQREVGFTLLEAIIVAALLAVLIGSVAQIMISCGKAQRVADMYGRATAAAHELLDEIRHDLVSSAGVFQKSTVADKYLALIDHFGDDPIASSTLPTPVEDGVFEQETISGSRTGNSLLAIRHEWTEQVTTTTNNIYSIDVYKLVYWFLTPKTQEGVSDVANLTLRQWVSEPLADGQQIDDISDPADRLEVQFALNNTAADYSTGKESVELVWIRGADPAVTDTLRHIDLDTGELVSAPRNHLGDGVWHIKSDSLHTSETFMRAYDAGIATITAPSRFGVGRFGKIDDAGTGFPHGFEVQIVGPPSARRALVQLTVLVVRGAEVPVGSDQSAITHFSEI